MEIQHLLGLAGILVLGVGAMWLSWRLRLPAILVLLVTGFLAGPIAGLIKPDELIGQLLIPLVSLAVAIILFEGGLNLKIAGLRQTAAVVRNLVTVGALITWAIGTIAIHFIIGLELPVSILLGAIFIVTGPTVIMPLLRYLRPTAQLNNIIKWEGVVIDPIGAVLAVLVFQVILTGGFQEALATIALVLVRTLLVASVLGMAGAAVIVTAFRKYWVPEYLHNAATLMLVIAVFAASNWMQADSGLMTVTFMGFLLANQKIVSVRHILEFKENLRVLIISSLFIILAARLELAELSHIGAGSLLLLAVLIFVARPAAVLASSVGSRLTWREKAFLAALAPRGIVAAAVSSLFAIRLSELGFIQAGAIVPTAFVVITGTVAVYGIAAPFVARSLGVAVPDPQGVLLVGGALWVRQVAEALHKEGIKVLLVDDTWSNVSQARMAGVPVLYANMLSEYALDELETGGLGYLIAGTSDDEYNSLVIAQFGNIFGRAQSFQVSPETPSVHVKRTVSRYLRGRILFNVKMTGNVLNQAISCGGKVKVTRLSPEYDYQAFKADRPTDSIPLFVITEKGKLGFFSEDARPKPQPGQKLISLILAQNTQE